MKYIIPLVFTSLSLLLSSGLALDTARVAAWNVAAGRDDKGGTPILADRIERLGKLIADKLKPDVLVLSEVWPASSSGDLAKAATAAGFPMEAVEIPAQDPEVVQLVTILKRPDVEVKDVSLIENSNDLVDGNDPEEKTTRKAVLATVKVGKFDFYLVGVHLKSKRPSKTITALPVDMRDRQCKTIADKLHALTSSGPEKDILVVGDYNMTPEGQSDDGEATDDKNFATLASQDSLRYLSSESKDRTHMGWYKGKVQRSKLDGYGIAKATETAYVPGSFKVMNFQALGVTERQFSDKRVKDYLTDHYPVVAEFDKTKDAD